MALVLAYGVVLLISVSLARPGGPHRAVHRAALLLAGALLGPGGLGVVNKSSEDEIVAVLADIALFTVLFTDGQRASVPALRAGWRLVRPGARPGHAPGDDRDRRALRHYLANLDWATAFLLGAILSPTDPVFASALVGRPDILPGCAGCSTWNRDSTTAWPCPSS